MHYDAITEVCSDDYAAAITANLLARHHVVVHADGETSLLLAACLGAGDLRQFLSSCVGYPGPLRGKVSLQLSALKFLLLGTNSLA